MSKSDDNIEVWGLGPEHNSSIWLEDDLLGHFDFVWCPNNQPPLSPERKAALDYLNVLDEDMPLVVLTPGSRTELELVEAFIQKLDIDSPWRVALTSKLSRMKTWADVKFGGRTNAPRYPLANVSSRLMGLPITEGDDDEGDCP